MSVPQPDRAPYVRNPAPDPAWSARGACVRHPDPDLWFETGSSEVRQQQAVDICLACPVKDLCLSYAMSISGLSGIWGGTTPNMRTRLRNQAMPRKAA